jgi:hypothetical protein
MQNNKLIYSLLLAFLLSAFGPLASANTDELILDADNIYAQSDEVEEDYESEGAEIPLDNEGNSSEDEEEE